MALDEGADGGDVMPGLVLYGVFAKKRFQDRRSRFAQPGILVHVGELGGVSGRKDEGFRLRRQVLEPACSMRVDQIPEFTAHHGNNPGNLGVGSA